MLLVVDYRCWDVLALPDQSHAPLSNQARRFYQQEDNGVVFGILET